MADLWLSYENIIGKYSGSSVGIYVSAQTQKGRNTRNTDEEFFGDGPILMEATGILDINQVELLKTFKQFAIDKINLRPSWQAGLWAVASDESYLQRVPDGIVTFQYGAGNYIYVDEDISISEKRMKGLIEEETKHPEINPRLRPVFEQFIKERGLELCLK